MASYTRLGTAAAIDDRIAEELAKLPSGLPADLCWGYHPPDLRRTRKYGVGIHALMPIYRPAARSSRCWRLDPLVRKPELQQDSQRDLPRPEQGRRPRSRTTSARPSFFGDVVLSTWATAASAEGHPRHFIFAPADDFVRRFVSVYALPTAAASKGIRIRRPRRGDTPMKPLARLAPLAVGLGLLFAPAARADTVKVGSKNFTEGIILGEIITQLLRQSGVEAEHRKALGGTRILFDALKAGDVDVYAEYTGTINEEILAGKGIRGDYSARLALAPMKIVFGPRLGFVNNYALGIREDVADRLDITISSDP